MFHFLLVFSPLLDLHHFFLSFVWCHLLEVIHILDIHIYSDKFIYLAIYFTPILIVRSFSLCTFSPLSPLLLILLCSCKILDSSQVIDIQIRFTFSYFHLLLYFSHFAVPRFRSHNQFILSAPFHIYFSLISYFTCSLNRE